MQQNSAPDRKSDSVEDFLYSELWILVVLTQIQISQRLLTGGLRLKYCSCTVIRTGSLLAMPGR